jgi:hypothetical protein
MTRPPLISKDPDVDLSFANSFLVREYLSPRWGLSVFPALPHGLRRGLHSIAASRLKPDALACLALWPGLPFPMLIYLLPIRPLLENIFRPAGACLFSPLSPRLAPWAAFYRRFAAEA